jgi:hypothetical protein
VRAAAFLSRGSASADSSADVIEIYDVREDCLQRPSELGVAYRPAGLSPSSSPSLPLPLSLALSRSLTHSCTIYIGVAYRPAGLSIPPPPSPLSLSRHTASNWYSRLARRRVAAPHAPAASQWLHGAPGRH